MLARASCQNLPNEKNNFDSMAIIFCDFNARI